MGEEIVRIVPGVWNWWIPLGIGLGMLIAAAIVAGNEKTRTAKILALVGILLCTVGTFYVYQNYVKPQIQEKTEVILSQFEPMQGAYQSPFYLKESVCEPGVWGEMKGNLSGFLVCGGNIYGQVNSGRMITVVYKDDDPFIDPYIGVHRSISLPLDEMVIETIATGEHPYLMYPEARSFQIRMSGRAKGLLYAVKLTPGTPHLYLPRGWKIL